MQNTPYIAKMEIPKISQKHHQGDIPSKSLVSFLQLDQNTLQGNLQTQLTSTTNINRVDTLIDRSSTRFLLAIRTISTTHHTTDHIFKAFTTTAGGR